MESVLGNVTANMEQMQATAQVLSQISSETASQAIRGRRQLHSRF